MRIDGTPAPPGKVRPGALPSENSTFRPKLLSKTEVYDSHKKNSVRPMCCLCPVRAAEAYTVIRAQGSVLAEHVWDSQRKDRGEFQCQGRKDAF